MKRLNLVLVSDTDMDGTPIVFEDNSLNPEDIDDQTMALVRALDSELQANPGLADLPEMKPLIEIGLNMNKAFGGLNKAADSASQAADTSANQQAAASASAAAPAAKKDEAVDNTQLGDNPFFGGDETPAVSGVTIENLPNILKDKFKVNTDEPDYLDKFLNQFSGKTNADALEYKSKYEEIQEGLDSLPKELQAALKAIAEGKDWRTVVGGAVSLDFSKDFADLSNKEKIAIHNHFFPDDKIDDKADLTDKVVSKSLSLAESKFSAEKQISTNIEKQRTDKIAAQNKAWSDSISSSIGTLKKEYPSFRQKELDEVKKIIEKDGIATLFVDKAGKLTDEGAKRVAFALYGEKILKATVAVAQNKGKSEGKADVLASSGSRGNKSGSSEMNLTDEEKQVMKMLSDAQKSATSSNPY